MPMRPIPQPISRTSSCPLMDANSIKFRTGSAAEFLSSSSERFPETAMAAASREPASASQVAAYCSRSRCDRLGQDGSRNARVANPHKYAAAAKAIPAATANARCNVNARQTASIVALRTVATRGTQRRLLKTIAERRRLILYRFWIGASTFVYSISFLLSCEGRLQAAIIWRLWMVRLRSSSTLRSQSEWEQAVCP